MMQNNLEGIEFTDVTDKDGLSYKSFREQLKPIYRKAWFDIFKGHFFLALVVAASIFAGRRLPSYWWVIIPLAAMLIGYIAAYLALFIHEAGHFNLHPDKKTNDTLATVFLCLPFGLSVKSYRKIHWQHHMHLGTPEDAEVSYFHPLSKLFFAESLTGIHLLRTMRRKDANKVLTDEQISESRTMLAAGALLHIALITVAFLAGHWIEAVSWIIGFGIFFPFFATIRQILEHRHELAKAKTDFYKETHGKVSRLFTNTILSSSFGSAGFTRHMIHHWDPQVSYTRLRDIEAFLSSSQQTADIVLNSKTNYRSVLKKLLRAS